MQVVPGRPISPITADPGSEPSIAASLRDVDGGIKARGQVAKR